MFDHDGNEVARHQLEHAQILPRPDGSSTTLWRSSNAPGRSCGWRFPRPACWLTDLAAIGLTNQRETTVVWDRKTGLPYMNAIVWQDTRTDRIAAELERSGGGELVRRKTGLLPATYFSAGKLQWALENSETVRQGGAGRVRPVSGPSTLGCSGT